MLSAGDKQTLHQAGFTIAEIELLDRAVDKSGKPQPPVDIHSPAWQSAIEHRRQFAVKARQVFYKTHGMPMSRDRFNSLVNMTFKGDIFQWLKITYQPRKRTDFMSAVKLRGQIKEDRLRRMISG